MHTISLPHRIRFLLRSRFFTGLFVASSTLISSDAFSDNGLSGFPLIPGATATGWAGPTVMGLFDAMVPLAGWPTSFMYVDPQFAIQNGDNYSGAGGLGYRWLSDQAGILGAYVFTDYLHSPNNNSFWFVSPGIERLGDTIDFSANAYIPVSSQQQSAGTVQGTEIGQPQFVRFQGHNQYDALFSSTESVGFGADAQIGYRLPIMYNPKVFVGGYYSDPQDSTQDNIWGGAVRVEVPLTQNIRVSLSEAYDNFYHNTVKVGLSVDLIGRHTLKNYQENNLASRMLDPIQRNLILVSGGSVTNQPIIQNDQFEELTLVRSNISFFEPVGTDRGSSQDGTFENPYQGLTQAQVDQANTNGNTNFYFNSGTYVETTTIRFDNDSIYGRQSYNGTPFVLPAHGHNRPVFDFSGMNPSIPVALDVLASADIVIEDIVLKGNASATGIFITADANKPIDLIFSDTTVNDFSIGIRTLNLGNIETLLLNGVVVSDGDDDGFDFINQGDIHHLIIQNSQFFNNDGDAIYINNALDSTLDALIIRNTFINNNIEGLAIDNIGAHIGAVIVDSSIIKNHDDNGVDIHNSDGAFLGGIHINASIINDNGSHGLEIINNASIIGDIDIFTSTFNNNNGDGINLQNVVEAQLGDLKIIESLLINNNPESGTAGGIFLMNDSSIFGDIFLTASIFSDNNDAGANINNVNNSRMGDIHVHRSKMDGTGGHGLEIINNASTLGDVLLDTSTFNHNSGDGINIQNLNEGLMSDLIITASALIGNNPESGSASGLYLINNSSIFGDIKIAASLVRDNQDAGISINNQVNATLGDIHITDETKILLNGGRGLEISNDASLFGDIHLFDSHFNHNKGDGVNLQNNDNGQMGHFHVFRSRMIDNNPDSGSASGIYISNNISSLGDIIIHASIIEDNNDKGVSINNTGGMGPGSIGTYNNGNNIGDVWVSETRMNHNGGRGLEIINTSGTFGDTHLYNSHFNHNGNDGVHVENLDGAQMGNIGILHHSKVDHNGASGFYLNNNLSTLGDLHIYSTTFDANLIIGANINNFLSTMGNILITDGTNIFNSGYRGLEIVNDLSSLGSILVTDSIFNDNRGDGINIQNTLTITSITFDTITTLGNLGTDIYVDNTSGLISIPSDVVTLATSIVGTENCLNCTFLIP